MDRGLPDLLWPVSGWEWSSPVSYWSPEHFFVQHSLMLLISVLRRKELAPSAEG